MLGKASPDPEATAWVCLNGDVAEIVSAAGYRLGRDSFAFDAGAMARKMLFHLTRPSAAVFPERWLVELEGRVERK